MANTMIESESDARPPEEAESRAPKFTWRNTDFFVILGIALLIFGATGMYQRITQGLAPTALSSYVPWGLWVGFYDYLVWLEVGSLLVFTALIYLVGFKQLKKIKPIVLFTGFVVLSMALLVVLLDLGQATRFWHVLIYPTFSSMIAWMVWAHILYLLVLVAELVLVYDFIKVDAERKDSFLKLLAYATLPLGLALILISGSVFGVVAARPLWSTSSLPLMFLISAVAAGSALLLLLTVLFWPDKEESDYKTTIATLSRLTAWMLLAGVFAASVIGFTTLYGGSPARTAAMQLILTGPFWWSFWLVHVLLGVFIPVIILFLKGHEPTWAGIAAFLATITFVAVTLNIVIPVLVTPEIQGLATVFIHPKLSFDYIPNFMEWQTILFIFGFGSLLFGLGWRILPIDEKMSQEH